MLVISSLTSRRSEDSRMATRAGINQPDAGSTSDTPGKVTLDVGGRKFITLASTLQESDFLSALVSGRWDHNRQADGSFFIDTKPDLFQHILEYLRRQSMPLCWDREKGHDLAMYKALLQEAEYYGRPRLSRWLSEGRYMNAVSVTTKITQKPMPDDRTIEFASHSEYRKVETAPREEVLFMCQKYPDHEVPSQCRSYCGEPREKRKTVFRATVADETVTLNPEVLRPS